MSVFIADENGTLVGIVLLDDEQAVLYYNTLAFQDILQLSNRQVTVGAVPVVPPISQTLQLFAQTTPEDVVLDDYPFEVLDVISEIAPTIYTISPSGQVVFSGTAPITFTPAGAGTTYTISPSGGVTFSGDANYSKNKILSPSGQIAFSGTVAQVHTKTLILSGQILFSGSSSQVHTRVDSVSGQVVFSGSAPLSFVSGAGTGGANQRLMVGTGT